ncbi:hypothetical protein LOTGIDRAFT_156493 [Lottia gigantea]|uniref:Uncharacterized protein n=1 Tax=Lottia gigantea TaxID=225164 RepID=V4BDT1_LOTGI|nr:hypothetical protein LOTGIDRAFT_156493 [Lottia gigantea]ESP03897.1 hypothetical protein LOTGIDRAFT_156493 [Lottia gigantea]
MRGLFLMTVLSTCMIGTAVDSVILGPGAWRHEPNPHAGKIRAVGKPKWKTSVTSCCKLGEKTAKKRLSCHLGVHAINRKLNRTKVKMVFTKFAKKKKRYPKALSNKIAKCSKAFPKNFQKCCNYRAEYYVHLAMCKKRRPKAEHYNRLMFITIIFTICYLDYVIYMFESRFCNLELQRLRRGNSRTSGLKMMFFSVLEMVLNGNNIPTVTFL